MTDGGRRRLSSAERALSPVVGKTMEVALVTLFVALLTSTLYGGVVPGYRTAAADEVGDRTLAAAAERVETAVPPDAMAVDSEARVDLPRTLRGAQYRLRANGSTLALDHPNDALDGRVSLSLPEAVVSVSGSWESDDTTVVEVTDAADGTDGLAVELVSRGAPR